MPGERTLALPPGAGCPDSTAGSVTFIGTATTLISYAGFTILADPNFLHRGEQVALGYGLRSTRLTDPALDIRDLPPLDLVLLSHLHEDHFDRIAERDLDHSLPVVTTPQAAEALAAKGFRATQALQTWESLVAERGGCSLRITATPGRHGPRVVARLLPQVMGSILEFGSPMASVPLRLYVSGGTLVFDDLREIPRRFPDIDLALLHLGGTRVFGVLLTMNGRQGVEALRIVAPKTVIPIHFDDYTVFKSPLSDFRAAVASAGLAAKVRYLDRGQAYRFEVPPSRRGERAA